MMLPDRIPLSEKAKMRVAWAMLFGSLVAWPLTHVWVVMANGFDPFEQLVLALSWWAITTTAWDVLSTSDVSAEQKEL